MGGWGGGGAVTTQGGGWGMEVLHSNNAEGGVGGAGIDKVTTRVCVSVGGVIQ